ncbi:MAG: UvrB/UvrC motif-containing protein, partial [Deltaproteobacteria bacterium]|nr:UvrB/UvrC motif-containing protein [Deltaproteobacteria bacterium]
MIERLRQDMQRAERDLEFEEAAALRDRIRALEKQQITLG